MERCKVARNVTVGGKLFKIVDPHDVCASLNKVLAKQEGATIITPEAFEKLKK